MANLRTEREQIIQLENYFKQKQFNAGLVQAEAVLQQFPTSFHLKFLQVKFLKELQRIGEALNLLLEMHIKFGDNFMILKELADLNFQQKRINESLIYYNKLLFIDSFNTHAQERVKQIQGLLEASVSEKLSDTQIEVHLDNNQFMEESKIEPPTEISFADQLEPEVSSADKLITGHGQELNFETESAAELYFKQGLYNEAMAIFKKLFEKTGNSDYFLKIKAILLLQQNEKSCQTIEKLQYFLELIQKRGSQIV